MSKAKLCFTLLTVLLTLLCSCDRTLPPDANAAVSGDVTDETGWDTTVELPTPDTVTDDVTSDTETETESSEPERGSDTAETRTMDEPVKKPETPQENKEIEIFVSDAPADCYTDTGKYEICLHSSSEYARDVMLTPSVQLKDFRFFIYDIDKYMTDNVCEITEVLYTSDSVSPDRPFIARILIPEFISSYGISYGDNNGDTETLMFCESGLDGSVLLSAFY